VQADLAAAELAGLRRNGTDNFGPGKPGIAGVDTATDTTLVWNRNLTLEQRERSARQRRADGLLSFGNRNAGDADTLQLADSASNRVAEKNPASAFPETSPLFATCMNPNCQTHWLRLWRRRQVPRMEGQWACSAECMQGFVEAAVSRELGGDMPWNTQTHRHRMPLGLILLQQGWITEVQLRAALDAQRTVRKGRIGNWLMRQCNLPEERVTRALAMQWGCPIFPVANHQPESVATLIPRIFLDSYGILPVRVASGRILYLGFEDRIDAAAALAIARMTGLRIETGIVPAAQYLRVHERMMGAAFPKAVLTEAATASAASQIFSQAIERVRPHEAHVVRIHQYLWLRMWRTPVGRTPLQSSIWEGASTGLTAGALPIPRIHQVEDLICRYTQADVEAN
jgi:hypothetical protein